MGIEDDLAVSGRAVSDVAHLVAELLENATSFSPPESAVVVSGAVTATGFVLAVSDQGIGMPADRIAEANQLLAKPPLVGLALSRALGLHVVGSLAIRHGIAVELRAGAPAGLVALVALPTSVLEPRAVPAPHAPPGRPPVYAPERDESGEPEPLGARRVAWRPADEPPVEEWRREGLAESAAAESAAATGAPATPPRPPLIDDPAFTSPPPEAHDLPRQGAEEVAEASIFDVAPTFDAPPVYDVPPTIDPSPVVDAGATFDSASFSASDSAYESASDAGRSFDASGAPTDPPGFDDQIPLPTRVPGQHLSHQPTPGPEEVDVDADPMRPYRVHELLTRHAQGKRRGRADCDDSPADPAMPEAFGHVQEDGR